MNNWYAIHTKPRQEIIAENNLQRQSFETYLPMIKQLCRRRGKWGNVIEPLFSRYLFVRLNLGIDDISTIRSTRGVSCLVRFGNEPAAVPDAFVDALMKMADEQTGVHLPKKPLFKQGDEITVLEGPFAGLSGIFQVSTGQQRAIILLDILGRAQRVNLHRDLIWPTNHNLVVGA